MTHEKPGPAGSTGCAEQAGAVAPTRPVLRYHGGKWLLAPWIISHFPPHRVYTEAFGGAASVLLRKPRSYAEVYNDLDGEVVNLFRVLRTPHESVYLRDLLRCTPFAREEFDAAYNPTWENVERARRLIVRSFMGFGSDATNPEWQTGFRANSNRSGTTPARDWANYPPHLATFVERMRAVVIENRPAREILRQHDAPNVLHYVDPPYVFATRSGMTETSRQRYRHELSDDDHRALAAVLRGLSGMVVLSGYPSALYDELYGDWDRRERAALADGAAPRIEVLWLNPACSAALGHGPLFRSTAS